MSSPVEERPTSKYSEDKNRKNLRPEDGYPHSEKGSYAKEGSIASTGDHLRVDTSFQDPDHFTLRSASARREHAMRLEDDLAVLEAERVVSRSTQDHQEEKANPAENESISRSRSRRSQTVDEFDEATNPLHEKAAVYNPPDNPNTNFAKLIKKLHGSSFVIRYLTYIVPLVLVLLIPLLVGALAYPNASVGGVELLWFSVWLEIVWLTLWAGRVRSPLLSSSLFFSFSSLFRGNLLSNRYRSSPNVSPPPSVSSPVSSPTMPKSGATWPSSSSSMPPSSSGGSASRSPSSPP